VTSWYGRIVSTDDLSLVLDACDFFETEYDEAVKEVDMRLLRGLRVEEIEKRLPGIVGYRNHQFQEIEAILGYLVIRQTAIKGARRRHYLEHYQRTLNPNTVEKYVEADNEVLAMATLYNQALFIRNKFIALSKQHEFLHYQLTNITKLIVAGVNDALL
jgi:hypothetical protein